MMMRLKILETISTAKWFWHSGTVMMMNDGVDNEIEDSVFGSFCFVSFGGVGRNYVGIYARCIRIFLCTITAPSMSNHVRLSPNKLHLEVGM